MGASGVVEIEYMLGRHVVTAHVCANLRKHNFSLSKRTHMGAHRYGEIFADVVSAFQALCLVRYSSSIVQTPPRYANRPEHKLNIKLKLPAM